MKKPFFKKWWVWIIVIIVVLFLAIPTDDGPEKVETTTGTESQETVETASEKEGTKENQPFKVGDTVKLNDAQITLKSAAFVEPTEYTPAKKGKVLAIEFETANVGDDRLYFGSEEFSISTSDGMQHDKYYAFGDGFINESINPGKKISGKIYYDVPEGTNYELIYTPSFSFDDKFVTFEITPQ